jgi:hypothetical protein
MTKKTWKGGYFKMDLGEMGCWMWTGFIWLRLETSGRLL